MTRYPAERGQSDMQAPGHAGVAMPCGSRADRYHTYVLVAGSLCLNTQTTNRTQLVKLNSVGASSGRCCLRNGLCFVYVYMRTAAGLPEHICHCTKLRDLNLYGCGILTGTSTRSFPLLIGLLSPSTNTLPVFCVVLLKHTVTHKNAIDHLTKAFLTLSLTAQVLRRSTCTGAICSLV